MAVPLNRTTSTISRNKLLTQRHHHQQQQHSTWNLGSKRHVTRVVNQSKIISIFFTQSASVEYLIMLISMMFSSYNMWNKLLKIQNIHSIKCIVLCKSDKFVKQAMMITNCRESGRRLSNEQLFFLNLKHNTTKCGITIRTTIKLLIKVICVINNVTMWHHSIVSVIHVLFMSCALLIIKMFFENF